MDLESFQRNGKARTTLFAIRTSRLFNFRFIAFTVICLFIFLLSFRSNVTQTHSWSTLQSYVTPSSHNQNTTTNSKEESTLPSSSTSSTRPSSPTLPPVRGGLQKFPPLLWQSTGPKPISDDRRNDLASWRNRNPFFHFELLTDEEGDLFVQEEYADRPDIVNLYMELPIVILKADLLRYLILYAKGGMWADMDVSCDKSVGDWLPKDYFKNGTDVSLMVGLEFDMEWRGEGTAIASQFTNWFLMAKPGTPHLLHVIDMIVLELNTIASDNNVPISGLKHIMLTDVVDVTGPKKMTIGIIESLSKQLGRPVDDRDYHKTKTPKLIGDVLVMPGAAFAASQNGHPTDQGDRLVTHHYAGSWKEPADKAREERKKAEEAAKKVEEEAKKKEEEEAKKTEEEEAKKAEDIAAKAKQEARTKTEETKGIESKETF